MHRRTNSGIPIFQIKKKNISEAFCIKIYAENLYYTFLFQIRIFLEAFKIKI